MRPFVFLKAYDEFFLRMLEENIYIPQRRMVIELLIASFFPANKGLTWELVCDGELFSCGAGGCERMCVTWRVS